METIDYNGVTFVKATALAKKHRYTTDYIGQLCRGGKVEAKLVGRAWFVEEKSLMNHKNDRYSTTRSNEITINKSLVSESAHIPVVMRREVRPVLTKGAHKSVIHTAGPATYHFDGHGHNRVTTYSQDTTDFATVPLVTKKRAHVEEESPKTTNIKVSLAEKASAKLSFEDLPEVSLQGDLTIVSLDNPELFEDTEPVTLDQISFTPEAVRVSPVTVTKRYQLPVPSHNELPQEISYNHTPAPLSVIPTSTESQNRRVVEPVAVSETVPMRSVSFVVVPVLAVISIVVSLLLLGLQSSVETDGVTLNQAVTFSWQTMEDSLQKILQSY